MSIKRQIQPNLGSANFMTDTWHLTRILDTVIYKTNTTNVVELYHKTDTIEYLAVIFKNDIGNQLYIFSYHYLILNNPKTMYHNTHKFVTEKSKSSNEIISRRWICKHAIINSCNEYKADPLTQLLQGHSSTGELLHS